MTVAVIGVLLTLAVVAVVMFELRRGDLKHEGEAARLAELAGNGDSDLLREMVGLRKDLRTERNKRLRDRLAGVLVTLAFLFLLNGQRETAADTTDAVARIEKTRGESRLASCQQDNIRIQQHNDLSTAVITLLNLSNQPNPARTAEQQTRVDAYFAQANALLNDTIVAPRDCTPPGIDAYLTPKPGG